MKYNSSDPIGIFDSGIGGLTVANAVSEQLPSEKIIYFGDTKHLPYGEKSPEVIYSYAEKIADFLLSKNCKIIVIACNSASSHAYEPLSKKLDNIVPVINVIDPVVDFISTDESVNKIGVIGTRATIHSRVYSTKINSAKKDIVVKSKATPLLASFIEEGFYKKTEITDLVLNEYLKDDILDDIDSMILACTHYPLIKNEINKYYKEKVKLFDSATIVASYIKDILKENELLNTTEAGQHEFYVSDFTTTFENTAKQFFKESIKLVEQKL